MARAAVWCAQLIMVLALDSPQTEGGFTKRTRYREINPADIRLRIRKKLDIINVTWKNPNRKINDWCYESNLQYKIQCHPDWLDFVLQSFNFTLQHLAKGSGRNYTFRVRMKYACLYRHWSAWTAEMHWTEGDILGSCFDANTNLHIVIIVIPVIFFLVLLAAQKQIRRLVLPKVPDPKHMYDDLMKIDQSQLEKTFKSHCTECVTMKIEVIHPEKDDEDEEKEEEEEEEEQSKLPADASDAESITLTPDTAMREATCLSDCTVHALEQSGYVCY